VLPTRARRPAAHDAPSDQ